MEYKAKAVLCRELNKPVVVETITVDGPKRGEVTVKLGACDYLAKPADADEIEAALKARAALTTISRGDLILDCQAPSEKNSGDVNMV